MGYSENDERVTKVGRIIRKTRIDELPQLVNILKGDMSVWSQARKARIDKRICLTDFNDRLLVKPGITGWAQVNGGYTLT